VFCGRVREGLGVWEMVLGVGFSFAWVEEGNHGCGRLLDCQVCGRYGGEERALKLLAG
jgi:hypothetical protein